MNGNVIRVPARPLKEQILERLRGVERAVRSHLSILGRGRLVGLPVL